MCPRSSRLSWRIVLRNIFLLPGDEDHFVPLCHNRLSKKAHHSIYRGAGLAPHSQAWRTELQSFGQSPADAELSRSAAVSLFAMVISTRQGDCRSTSPFTIVISQKPIRR